jgi:hypothetical protein
MTSKRENTEVAHTDEHFEFGGKTFLAKGTSGPPTLPVQHAPGRPVRHDLTVGGRAMQTAGTSGPHPAPVQIAPGRPTRSDSVRSISSPAGAHAPVGRPVRTS